MKNINILYVDTCLDVAGGQRSLIALLTNIASQINFSILIDETNKKYEQELLKAGIPNNSIIKIKTVSVGGRALGGLKLFKTVLCKSAKFDIIHCNTFYDGLFAMPAARLRGKKTIFRARCGIDLSNHGYIDNIIYNFSTRILANSDYVKNTFSRVSSDLNKVISLYNPLDMKFQKEINPDAFNWKHEAQESYVIAVVGAITEVKNQMEVLKALAQLNDTSIKLRFIGEPRSTDKDRNYYSGLLNYAKKKNLLSQVEFTGFVSDVRDKLGDVNLVCVPSDREPLGRVIFESQLFGIPVLASDSGGNSELIEDGSTGYLYALGDVNELAIKLLKVKDNNHQLALDAQQFVLKRFSPERTYLEELNLYHVIK
ncbi:glycosyltransferase [Klebsiella grimontii]|uniref:glycosyltransferase n=1 Tax=Klebsiella grimontii TaxID=2058152 RepID=UPI001F4CCCE6|nr:glycosyltransferase [Klebsiella grimontii]MDT8626256.1 glycosyltransferase [Klebsiella grimontii]UNF14506.1 glycosyltransferase [Klebsiella grimontii]